MTRSRAVRLVVWVVVVGCTLALGTFEVASAGSLTHKKVRAIAVKAIRKAAPTLSVAHAATAGDASTVGGLSAASLQTSVRQYVVPPTAGAAVTTYTVGFPGLPAGSYVVTYSLVLDFTLNSGFGFCELLAPPDTTHLAESVPSPAAFTGSCTATTTLVVAPGGAPVLHVSSAGTTFKVSGTAFPSTVTFTRVDSVTSAPAVVQ